MLQGLSNASFPFLWITHLRGGWQGSCAFAWHQKGGPWVFHPRLKPAVLLLPSFPPIPPPPFQHRWLSRPRRSFCSSNGCNRVLFFFKYGCCQLKAISNWIRPCPPPQGEFNAFLSLHQITAEDFGLFFCHLALCA